MTRSILGVSPPIHPERSARPHTDGLRSLALVGVLALALPGPASAQQDTSAARRDSAHVSYRTEDMVFVTAGRLAGLAVGDTVELVAADGSVVTRAIVMSVAQRTASAAENK